MRWMRGRLARLAAGWLLLQLSLMVSAQTALCASSSAASVDVTCTCGHGDDASCPMHHHGAGTSRSDAPSQPCSCRPTDDPGAVLVGSLLGPTAILASSAAVDASETVDDSLADLSLHAFDRSTPPVSPPPRS